MFQKQIERIYILFWDIKRKREMNIPSKKKIKKIDLNVYILIRDI